MRYARHPSTQVLMLSWAWEEEDVQQWFPLWEPMPERLKQLLDDPTIDLVAWNAQFERTIFKFVMKMMPAGRWRDTQVHAKYLAMPDDLFRASRVLRLGDLVKTDGKKYINLFCKPRVERVRTVERPHVFNDWDTHPAEWDEFCGYGGQDVVAERAIANKISVYPMPLGEWANWELDQKINEEGLPVNPLMAEQAIKIAEIAKADLKKQLIDRTGLANPLSKKQLLAYAKDEGYERGNMRKKTITKVIEDDLIDDDLGETLQMSVDASQTAHTKFRAVVNKHWQNRLHFTFSFMGASRTGRYSAFGFQPHNLKRTPKWLKSKLAEGISAICYGQTQVLQQLFGKTLMEIIGCMIRSVIQADEGRIFRVCDLNAIENRVLGWLANCPAILRVFEQGLDPYLAFAAILFGRPYESFKKSDKERDDAKPAVLGAGYALSGGEIELDKNGDEVKTGLWGYAESLGVKLTRAQCHEAIKVWREAHPEVLTFWGELDNAAWRAVNFNETVTVRHLVFDRVGGFMRIKLPSGRHLWYYRPRYEQRKFKSKTDFEMVMVNGTLVRQAVEYTRNVLTYEGMHQTSGQWVRMTTHAGKLTENVTQAVARDVLQIGLRRADKDGFTICGHVHDEIITHEDEDDDVHTLPRLRELMTAPIPWAPGLPLAAAGYEEWYYFKD